MINVLMVLKTQSLKNDQRVLKELASFKKLGAEVDVFVAKDCDLSQSNFDYPLYETKIFGGAAPSRIIVRIIGILQFYIKAMSFIAFKSYSVVWVCDPIMFLLVLALKKIKPELKVVWDHHELPPSWFLKNKVLMRFFKKAYRNSDIIIHANSSRKKYLENCLNIKAKESYIISNYPSNNMNSEEILDDEAEAWLKKSKPFIYLQNSLQENRYGYQVIRAALGSGYKIFHAGKINKDYLDKYDLYNDDVYLAGYLSVNQINRVLKECDFTVILYKQDSLNQIYCDANRLYQSMYFGVPLIIGDNPTLVEATKKYRDCIVLKDDGRSFKLTDDIIFNKSKYRAPLVYSWCEYDAIFIKVLNND